MKCLRSKKKYDLIIKFTKESYVDIRNDSQFNELAEWKKHGTLGFRGFCLLDKEETEKFIVENLKLDLKDYQVIKATSLYMPS